MSGSESESSSSYSDSSEKQSEASNNEESDNEAYMMVRLEAQAVAYQNEPLADPAAVDDCITNENGETDEDGLSPAILESRYERSVYVNDW